jgi:uncharacterized protein YcfJ
MTTSLSRVHLTSLIALALLAGGASARGLAQPQQAAPPSTVMARVVSATPQWQQVPVQVCNPAATAPTGGGAAVGALAGGAIGSQMGRGDGRVAGAVVGAIGGALAGNAIEAHNRAAMGAGCGVQYQNQVAGYDVRYEWSGRQYRTQMAADPGSWIRVTQPVGNGSYAEPAYADAAPQQQPAYSAPPEPVYSAPPPTVGTQVPAPQPAYGAYPYPVYQRPVMYPQAAYPVYPAPVLVRPAPVYVGPPVGLSIGVGGGGWRRGGWGVGLGVGF